VKSKFLIVVLTWGLVIPICATAAPFQDLDRINDIVNQARNLAQSARTGAGNAQPDARQSGYNNPFSSGTANSDINVQGANGTGVEVEGNQIRVKAGGQQFVFPRSNTPTSGRIGAGTAGSGAAGLVNGNRTADQAMKMVAGYQNFADAVQLFRNAEFNRAATQMKDAATTNLKQPVFDPFQSLCLFATGDYIRSAEFAYSAAAQSPVWGWEQLKGYYGDPDIYAQQYRQLQNVAKDPNVDVSVRFLLGYHHLMLGHRNHASRQFELVLTKLPNDPVTRRLLHIANQGPPQPMN